MQEFYIKDGEISLHAKLDMPEENGPCPLVILVHGLTGHMEEPFLRAVQKSMNEAGFAVLRTDLYGHGKSDGAFRDHTLEQWSSDLTAVTEYAKQLPFVTDLYLCGHSQGGLLAVMAAGMRPDDYQALILLSPALTIPEDARKGNFLGTTYDPLHIPEDLEIWGDQLGSAYFRTVEQIRPEEYIRRYRKPVLIVHGEKDELIPVSSSVNASQHYENCRLAVIPDDDHEYDLHPEMMCEAVTAFLKEQACRSEYKTESSVNDQ